VRRNITALEQPAFREGAGSGIVIPNVIILNWVCWWVATRDPERPGELMDERLRLWRLLWGAGNSGYLNELDDDHHALVLERFDSQLFEAVTLASIADVWAHTESYTDPRFRALRAIVRTAVVQPCWQVTAKHVLAAVRLINSRPTTPEPLDAVNLAGILWDTACAPVGDDARDAIAAALGRKRTEIEMSEQPIKFGPKSAERLVSQALMPAAISPAEVDLVFATWQGVQDLDYYRLKWDGGVAVYRAVTANGWIWTKSDDSMIDLDRIKPSLPAYRQDLDRLYDETAKTATRSA
jgi:hypothetical protein